MKEDYIQYSVGFCQGQTEAIWAIMNQGVCTSNCIYYSYSQCLTLSWTKSQALVTLIPLLLSSPYSGIVSFNPSLTLSNTCRVWYITVFTVYSITFPLQWNLSNPDTNGAGESVIVSEVSSFQRLQEWYI